MRTNRASQFPKNANFAIVEAGNPVVTMAHFYRERGGDVICSVNLNGLTNEFREEFEYLGDARDFGYETYYQSFASQRKQGRK